MKEIHSTEELDYEAGKTQPEQQHYTPRPKFHIVLAWILLGVVIFAILGMCYWEIFGKF